MVSDGPQERFYFQASQHVHDCTIEYRVVVTQRLMTELPSLRTFDGWFNVNNLELLDRTWDTLDEPPEWIQLNPEGLAMQLLRLAYIAAVYEESVENAVPSPL